MVRTMALRRYASPQCGPNEEEEMPKIVAETQACFRAQAVAMGYRIKLTLLLQR